jgi:hypothetical protein
MIGSFKIACCLMIVAAIAGCASSKSSTTGGATRPAISLEGATRPAEADFTPKDWTDRSTPVGTMVLIHLSTIGRMPVYLDECTYAETQEGRDFLASCARGKVGAQRLDQAIRDRFPNADSLIPKQVTPAEAIKQLGAVDSFFEDVKQVVQRIDGDHAILVDPRKPDLVCHARKTPSGWQLKLEEIGGGVEKTGVYPFRDAKAMIKVADMGLANGEALRKRIEAGEFKTPEELRAAIETGQTEFEKKLGPYLKP